MGKIFNISGDCKKELHYMVNPQKRLIEIKKMVDKGNYFVINRARQYGKTTTLKALSQFLEKDYAVVSLDFQMLGASKFRNENTFSLAFARLFLKAMGELKILKGQLTDETEVSGKAARALGQAVKNHKEEIELLELFEYLSEICRESPKPVVMLIDEVDSAANNQVFLDFLAQLRGYYISRDKTPTFWSVILAGIYNIKNIRSKIRTDEEHKSNSPWNIAMDFLVDMSFSAGEIGGMLLEYEDDYKTGMDIDEIAGMIYDYTSGYPFLVSCLCKLMDERIAGSEGYLDKKAAFTKEGVLEAVRLLLSQENTLFDSLLNKVRDYPELDEMLRKLLFNGKEIIYVVGIPSIEIALMFGLVKRQEHIVLPANRIFEILLYNYFLASPKMQKESFYDAALKDKNQFICQGHLNMELILERFVLHFDELYGDKGQSFLEEDGRRYFLLYLRPIINGVGNYYIESRTRNMERTDIIVDYRGEQFVIELKIWRGNAYNERGEEQLSAYLNYYHLRKGYMLSFNFNRKKQVGVKKLRLGERVLVEAVV